jgi:simple sugar transport system ATP-binding protein
MDKTNNPLVLQAKGLTKRFPGVLANDKVDLDLYEGEVLALLGENGAGKSTLMNMLYGLYHPDEGEIYIRGEKVELKNPRDAIDRGVGMVHQHFQLVPVMSVAENVMLGAEITRGGGILSMREAERRVAELSEQYGLEVDPTSIVEDLPVGTQQRVEIIKALYRNANILILDEPTAVLTPQEANELFRIMRDLTERGVSIIFITHKLKEVLAAADHIGVLRRGRLVGTAKPEDSTEASLAEMMVGRNVILTVEKEEAHPTEPVLRIEDLVVKDDRGHRSVKGVSMEVRAGEIVGIAGVQGNGQRELIEAITGLRSAESGHAWLEDDELTGLSPRKITEMGVAHIPEDREKHGLVMSYSLADNMVLSNYYQPPFAKNFIINQDAIDEQGDRLVKEYDVRTPSAQTPAGNLSGGNKQKVIVAREFSRPTKLLIAAQPTRGIDVGSIEFIHNQIVAQRDRGIAVLVVSAELDEVLGLADRVVVMFDGHIVATLPAKEATRERVGLLMAGSTEEAVVS